jgi:hypothetical protein
MSEFVRRVRPARWKVFQVLPVTKQNDGSVEGLLNDGDQFRAFVARHHHLEAEELGPIAEDNDAMTDPSGRFYGNFSGRHIASAPILDVGIDAALGRSVSFPRGSRPEAGCMCGSPHPSPTACFHRPRSTALPVSYPSGEPSLGAPRGAREHSRRWSVRAPRTALPPAAPVTYSLILTSAASRLTASPRATMLYGKLPAFRKCPGSCRTFAPSATIPAPPLRPP